MAEITANVKPHTGTKCPRCWNYHYLRDTHDGLCDRCQGVIVENFPDHGAVPFIKTSIQAERKKYCVRAETEACPALNCCRTSITGKTTVVLGGLHG